jgi:hypothetical protein
MTSAECLDLMLFTLIRSRFIIPKLPIMRLQNINKGPVSLHGVQCLLLYINYLLNQTLLSVEYL